ncbi:MAG: FG-GAP-like repeat-containing protein, partial [Armatimonadota bacterium]
MRFTALIVAVLMGAALVCAQDRLQQTFDRLDRDGDGRVTVEEAGGAAWFARSDANNDGAVTLAEARANAGRRNEGPGMPVGDVVTDVPASPADGIFQLAWVHPEPTAQATALLDLTGNGALDLAIAAKRQLHIVTGDGAGAYTHKETYRVDRVNGWGAHDFNADGRLDLFLAQPEGNVRDSWLNNGDGTFSPVDLGNETVGTTRNVVFADFDRDGFVDSYHSVSAFGTNHRGSELHPGLPGGRFGPDIIDRVLDPPVPDFWYRTITTPEGRQERWANKQFKG